MKVLHYVRSLSPVHGGPSRSVPNLAAELARSGVAVALCSSSSDVVSAEALRAAAAGVRLLHTPRTRGTSFRDEVSGTDVVHLHGLWTPSVHRVSAIAAGLGKPIVHSCRGMLEPWALRHKRARKRLAWNLYQRRDLRRASRIHATSAMEASHLAALGFDRQVVVIPNGTEIPTPPTAERPDLRQILFLSRLQKKKGLDLLGAAAHELREDLQRGGWSIVVAGPEEDDSLASLRHYLEEHRLTHLFSIRPPVDGSEKWDLLSNASLFVLPTHSENFGLVIAESLAAATPVITTTATPWQEIGAAGCGWWVDPDVTALTAALREATALSHRQRLDMGRRGRELVTSRYSWPAVAKRFGTLYETLVTERA